MGESLEVTCARICEAFKQAASNGIHRKTKEGPYGPSLARFYTPLEDGNDLRSRSCLPRRPTRARPAWPVLRESAAFEPPFARVSRLFIGRLGRRLKGRLRSDTSQRREKLSVIWPKSNFHRQLDLTAKPGDGA